MRVIVATILCFALCSPALATTWTIGDDDGFGVGLADNANHPFDGVCDPLCANVDNRDASEQAATNGAQFTDTYSTAHPGYSPQAGTLATFSFTGLGTSWSVGALTVDMADFQASTFGAVKVDFNGVVQNWAFNDGYPSTKVRIFSLDAATIASINLLGSLTIAIDRNNSADFYGFDYMCLADSSVREKECGEGEFTPVPAPAPLALLGLGLAALGFARRKLA